MKALFTAVLLGAAAIVSASDINYSNWQELSRGDGLRHFGDVVHRTMTVNPSNPLPITKTFHADYEIYQLPSIKALQEHPAIDAIVVLNNGNVTHEFYGKNFENSGRHSVMSSSKTLITLLLERALKTGKLDLNKKVKEYIPEIGSGYANATVQDVLNMNVQNEHDEMASYLGEADHVAKEESAWGFGSKRDDAPDTAKEYLISIKSADVENVTGKYIYKSPNTSVSGWVIERATGVPLQQQVVELMEEVRGEAPVSIAIDKTGWPCTMGGLVMTARDFARYGLLLANLSPDYLKKLRSGGTSMGSNGFKYHNQAYTDGTNIGHAGWGGQFIWVHPETKTVVAVFSSLESFNPALPEYAALVIKASQDVVKHYSGS